MSKQAVLFDLDGTLINTIPLIRLTFEKVFADFGIPWGNGEVLETIGLPLRQIAERYAPGRAEAFLEAYSSFQSTKHKESGSVRIWQSAGKWVGSQLDTPTTPSLLLCRHGLPLLRHGHGLHFFKRRFGGERHDFIGEFDLVLRPVEYRLWQWGKPLPSVLSRIKRLMPRI